MSINLEDKTRLAVLESLHKPLTRRINRQWARSSRTSRLRNGSLGTSDDSLVAVKVSDTIRPLGSLEQRYSQISCQMTLEMRISLSEMDPDRAPTDSTVMARGAAARARRDGASRRERAGRAAA
jgi:hypothetical protein